MLDVETVREAVIRVVQAQSEQNNEAQPGDYVHVVNAFDAPKLKFDPDRKRFFTYGQDKFECFIKSLLH